MFHQLWLLLRYRRNDVRRYGAVPDGVTDCSEAFSKAVAAASAGGLKTVRWSGSGPYRLVSPVDTTGVKRVVFDSAIESQNLGDSK